MERLTRRPNARLRQELRNQGRSLEWFCQQVGVSRWAFYRIENGEAGAPVDWYRRSAAVLGVSEEVIAPEPETTKELVAA